MLLPINFGVKEPKTITIACVTGKFPNSTKADDISRSSRSFSLALSLSPLFLCIWNVHNEIARAHSNMRIYNSRHLSTDRLWECLYLFENNNNNEVLSHAHTFAMVCTESEQKNLIPNPINPCFDCIVVIHLNVKTTPATLRIYRMKRCARMFGIKIGRNKQMTRRFTIFSGMKFPMAKCTIAFSSNFNCSEQLFSTHIEISIGKRKQSATHAHTHPNTLGLIVRYFCVCVLPFWWSYSKSHTANAFLNIFLNASLQRFLLWTSYIFRHVVGQPSIFTKSHACIGVE